VTRYIDEQRATFGVEPICRTLAKAPSSYYAARARPPSARSIRDAALKADIGRLHLENYAGRHTERLADEGAVTSVRSRGDRYHNALAGSVNGLHKTELIQAQGPRRTADQVELATAAWVACWNEQRLHSTCGDVPPAEFEAAYHYRPQATEAA
jgi:transposase InsO family protein